MNRTVSANLIWVAVLLAALGLGVVIGTVITWRASADRQPVADRLRVQGGGEPLAVTNNVDLMEGFSAVAKAVAPAVVNISTQSRVTPRRQSSPGGLPDDFHEWFFGRGAPREFLQRNLGSGIIVDSHGFIVTNNHVVGRADKITVKLADGREFSGTLIGSDPETDIAVVRIRPDTPIPFARMGDVEKLNVGDWVLAIGSPFGLEQTVTSGIISAKGRAVQSQSIFSTYLQTDASINPGNSGGPLVNLAGEVVGINTFIQTRSGGNIGIGFAVPADTVINVYNQIVETGKVSRGWLGISMNTLPLTEPLRQHFRLPSDKGVIVTDLPEGDSPARAAGIQAGDVIVSIAGREVDGPDTLRALIANTPPDTEIEARLVRNGQEKTIRIKLAQRADALAQAVPDRPFDLDEEARPEPKKEIGLTVEPVPANAARQLRLDGAAILVSQVRPGSVAEEAGLEDNDIILEVDGKPAGAAREFVDRIRALGAGESVVLKFIRVLPGGARATFYTSLTKP